VPLQGVRALSKIFSQKTLQRKKSAVAGIRPTLPRLPPRLVLPRYGKKFMLHLNVPSKIQTLIFLLVTLNPQQLFPFTLV